MIARVWIDGWRRVLAAPALIAGVFVLTLALALPLAWTMRDLLRTGLGGSLAAETMAASVNYDWWQEFTSQTSGLGSTFTTAIVGFAATLDSISSVLDAQRRIPLIAGALVLYLLGWLLLTGGIIDRLARQRPTRATGFFAAGGRHLFPLLRLAAIAGLLYWLLFARVHPWLFSTWLTPLTHDLDTERTAFAWRVLMYVIFGLLLVTVNVIADYAKIRLVVEDRHSAIGAFIASIRFLVRHPLRTIGLYALNSVAFLTAIGIWALVTPGVGGGGAAIWLAFLAGQLYVIARLLLKLQFIASQTALFQSSLAHAGYAAAPEPVWPESPAAESLGR